MHPSRSLRVSAVFSFKTLVLLSLVALTPALHAQSYTWTTFAGGRPQYGSADGSGSAARFNLPRGIVVDTSGNTIVADTDNHTIRKITPAGVVTTIGGLAGVPGTSDGNASTSRFNSPDGLVIDASGNIYVADSGNHTIRLILSGGIIATFAGRGGVPGSADGASSAATFNSPSGLAFDGTGSLLVVDTGNHTLRKIAASGVVSTFVGVAGSPGSADGGPGVARFNSPVGVTHDANGNLYVTDTGNHTIRKITAAGVVTTLSGAAGIPGGVNASTGAASRFNSPYGILSDASGTLLVADYGNSALRLVDANGAAGTYFGRLGGDGYRDGPFADARFFHPTGLALAPDNSIVVSDTGNLSIRRLTTSDVATTLAGPGGNFGRVDATGIDARFSYPNGITITPAGDLLVADSGSGTLRRISPAGVVQTIAGGDVQGYADGAPGVNKLNYPSGLVFAPDGTIFFCERQVHTVRAMIPNGTVLTVAGTNTLSGSTNAVGAAARFNLPSDIARDSSGNLYIADTANHVIRRIDITTTAVSTFAGAAGAPGTDDGTGGAARFNAPRGICSDASGNFYVSDFGNHTIRRISSTGVVTTFAGLAGSSGDADGTLATARFTQPAGLTFDRSGRLLVADSGNQTLRLISGNSVVTIGGLSGVAGYADGPGSTSRFFIPDGVTVDSAGNIYVVEAGNNLIVKGTLNTPSVAGRLINLSISTDITTAADSFTLGYVVGGGGTVGEKSLVIRAVGPSLGIFGVPNTLPDPKLELFAGSTKTGENDNWGGSASLAGAFTAVGAFAYTGPASKDSAVAVQIKTRDNSVSVSSSDGGTGKVIAEVYDATPSVNFATITPRLLNVSVRKHLGSGLTAGFVIGGSTSVKVLIRVVGPGLAAFGVAGTVDDPQLTLFNASSAKIDENNDWGGTPALTAAFTSVGAFNLPGPTSKDAALLATLQPGNYTVEAKGVNNTTGVALVEVYEVP